MEYIIGLLLLVVGFLYNQNNKKKAADILEKTKIRDQALKEQEIEAKAQIKTLDEGIERMKRERELEIQRRENEAKKQAEDAMTLKERADRLKKGFNKN